MQIEHAADRQLTRPDFHSLGDWLRYKHEGGLEPEPDDFSPGPSTDPAVLLHRAIYGPTYPFSFLEDPCLPRPWMEDGWAPIQEVDFETLRPIGRQPSQNHTASTPKPWMLGGGAPIQEVDFETLTPIVRKEQLDQSRPRPGAKARSATQKAPRLRPTVLTDEARRLLEAISFFNRSEGLIFNTLLTTSIQALTPQDLPAGMRLHCDMNKMLADWLAVGLDDPNAPPRYRRTVRAAMGGSEHAYVWVVENARDMGLHVHQLMYVPPTKHRDGSGRRLRKSTFMERQLRDWWAKQIDMPVAPTDAVHTRFYKTPSERNAIAQQWEWYRYIIKTLNPEARFRDLKGRWVFARDILRPDPFIKTEPAPVTQLAGGSHKIGAGAQRKAEFRSAFARCEFDQLYSGWELDAYREWQADLEREAQAERRFGAFALFPRLRLTGTRRPAWIWEA